MNKKVFLSAGHGGKDPGAVGNCLKEKDINLEILLSCKSELERHGVQVVSSRVKDEDDPVSAEVKEANASGADIAISFHTNAGGGDGSEAYYYSTSAESKKLAELGEKYVKEIGQNSRGIKKGNSLWFVKSTSMPAVLYECAFIDSSDVKVIDSSKERKAFGVAYAKAILEYFGITYKDGTVTPTPPVTGSFLVKVNISNLWIRKGAGTNFDKVRYITPGTYTIVEVKAGSGSDTGWGRLKSGAGWISLDYAKRV